MMPVFCFIDDAQFELENFRRNAAPSFKRFDFVYAATFTQAKKELAGRRPLCFLLDLYGSDPLKKEPALPSPEALSCCLGQGLDLPALYQDLGQAGPEAGNVFLRRLYGQVEAWQQAFLLAAQGLGQGRSYGMQNLKAVRQEYPWAAALGYSRKALYADAVAMSMAGAEGLLQKPQGPDDQAIAQATIKQAPALAQAAYQAVERRLMLVLAPMALRLVLKGGDAGLALAIFEALSARQGDTKPAARCLEDLAQMEQGHPCLEPEEAQAVLSLRDWVQAWG
ncbi:MAG: hypothetical protein PVG60_08745 [Desulfarculaceae bacterium]|jgi:hypothetical protein